MEKLIIENEEQCKAIFDYCVQKLPVLNGFDLQVSKPVDLDESGVRLTLFRGETIVSDWSGLDEEDALLCIYKDLVNYLWTLVQ